MSRAVIAAASLAVIGIGVGADIWWHIHHSPAAQAAAANHLLHKYCSDCHNPIDLAGNMSLADKDFAHVGSAPETWEHVVRKLKTGMMPPAGEPP